MSIASILVREVVILLVLCNLVVNSSHFFNDSYEPLWGVNHLSVLDKGRKVELLLNTSSGSGFRSKQKYCSGVFRMRMKIPKQKSGGVITSFYLISEKTNGNHDEIDFELLGTNGTLQTNIFTNDGGHREERIQLWFDPSQKFHSYEISFDQNKISFKVDGRRIRVFEKKVSENYISMPLHVEASIWNGTWAGIVDWSKTPFKAYYKEFHIKGSVC